LQLALEGTMKNTPFQIVTLILLSLLLGACGDSNSDSGSHYSTPPMAFPGDDPKITKQPPATFTVDEGDAIDLHVTVLAPSTYDITLYKRDGASSSKVMYDTGSNSSSVDWSAAFTDKAHMSDTGIYYFEVVTDKYGTNHKTITSRDIHVVVKAHPQPKSTTPVTSTQISSFEGLYNATIINSSTQETDETYYSIDHNGVFHTYNYLQDDIDKGANCYRPAQAGDINAGLEGRKLYYDSAKQEFVVRAGFSTTNDSVDMYFKMDGSSIDDICADNGNHDTACTSSTSLTDHSILILLGSFNLVLLKERTTSGITLNDIESNLCQ
jgi:hypothetical protein